LKVDSWASTGRSWERLGSLRKTSRFTTEQIVAILQEHAVGASPADLIRCYCISRPAFSRWKKRYGDLQVSQTKRLKASTTRIAALSASSPIRRSISRS